MPHAVTDFHETSSTVWLDANENTEGRPRPGYDSLQSTYCLIAIKPNIVDERLRCLTEQTMRCISVQMQRMVVLHGDFFKWECEALSKSIANRDALCRHIS